MEYYKIAENHTVGTEHWKNSVMLKMNILR